MAKKYKDNDDDDYPGIDIDGMGPGPDDGELEWSPEEPPAVDHLADDLMAEGPAHGTVA
jgi:hypothetical protein